MDSVDSTEEINTILDESDFIYEALDPEFQELASDLIARFSARLNSLA